jgi:hypothetical protein
MPRQRIGHRQRAAQHQVENMPALVGQCPVQAPHQRPQRADLFTKDDIAR